MPVTQDILDLSNEIIANVYELDDVQQIIKGFAKQDVFSEQDEFFISQIGERHIKLMKRIKVLLEVYFVEEAKNSVPVLMAYRRLYKQLKLAI
jgi:hypothetical protein